MAYIRTIDEPEASGSLAREYENARQRTGKIFNILKVQSLAPEALRASISLYLAVMHGPSELTRAERELIAVVVSAINECHY